MQGDFFIVSRHHLFLFRNMKYHSVYDAPFLTNHNPKKKTATLITQNGTTP